MILYPALSLENPLPHRDALPDATFDRCGEKGINVAVGNTAFSTVYRGTFNSRDNTGSWTFLYHKEGNESLTQPDFDLEYMCKVAMIRVRDTIQSFK